MPSNKIQHNIAATMFFKYKPLNLKHLFICILLNVIPSLFYIYNIDPIEIVIDDTIITIRNFIINLFYINFGYNYY